MIFAFNMAAIKFSKIDSGLFNICCFETHRTHHHRFVISRLLNAIKSENVTRQYERIVESIRIIEEMDDLDVNGDFY